MASEKAAPAGNKMGVEPIRSLLIKMAVPLMLSMLVQACYNIVDSIYVSRISEDALTAVSMAFPVQSIMLSISSGICIGMNAILSKSLGERNFEKADNAANTALFLAICCVILNMLVGFFIARPFYMSQISYNLDIVEYGVTYLRIVTLLSFGFTMQMTFERMLQSTGRTLHTMVTQMSGAIINIILDPLLIFGIGPFPKLGVAGAAYATVIGQWIAGFLAFLFNIKFNNEVHIRISRITHPSGEIVKQIAKIGIPSIIMQSIGSVMYYGMNLMLTGFSSTASAVFGVYFKLQSFFFMPIFGLNGAVIPIMSFNYGAQKRSRMISTLKNATLFAIIIMSIGTIVFETIPQVLLGFFNASEHMLEIGVPALRIIGVHFPIAAVCIVLGTTFQALQQATYSALVSLGRQLIVLLPAAFILSRLFGLGAIWWCFPIAELISLTLTSVFFIRIYRTTVSKVPDLV